MNPDPNESGLHWLLAASRDPMLVCDADGVIVRANRPLAELFGWPPEELIGEPVEILVPPELRGRHAALRRASGPDAARAMGVARFTAVDQAGSAIPVEVSLSALRHPGGTGLTLATVHDQRARIAAERTLQESEVRMRSVFETVADGIVTIDEDGAIERVNPAAARMFGYTEDELAGRDVGLLMPVPERARHGAWLRSYLASGAKRIIGKEREVHALRKDGRVFPIELAVTEMRIGERRMFTGVVRDITASKAAQQDLARSHAALRALAAYQERIKESERQRIAREIHDELGGLLTGIKAYVSVVGERWRQAGGTPDPLLGEAGALAQEAIDTVRRVITDLRPSVLDQLGIWAALDWCVGQVAQRAGLEGSCEIALSAARLEVDADRSIMLFRIVQEALTNVQRHAGARSVRLRVAHADGVLALTLEDDGRGIDPALAAGGADCWGILGMQERSHSLGGELTLAPRPGGGTVLRLRVPMGAGDGGGR